MSFRGHKPILDVKSLDMVVVEGEKLSINLPFVAVPKPSITWYKNGKEFHAMERVTMDSDLFSAQLNIVNTVHNDAGTYTITLENKNGSTTGTIKVKVIGEIMAGKTLRLPATVTGRPFPEITWQREGHDVDKKRVTVIEDGNNTEIILKNCLRSDHGKFSCNARNICGSKTAYTSVDVMGECVSNKFWYKVIGNNCL
uniref:Ig-like domain-containing protein n=1 Tax=Eptatretus burgeri TaxID=7764 RepID=A0A8C4QAY1_EPTBU